MIRNFNSLFENNETKTFSHYSDGYYFKEEFKYKEICDYVSCTVYCSQNEEMTFRGSVDINLHVNKFINEHSAGFGYLEVPLLNQGNGIGKALMYDVIKIIHELKEHYSIQETIKLSGRLSQADKLNGNWNISVPLYEKVGKNTETKAEFLVKDSNFITHYATEFIRNAGESDGTVTYYI